MDILLQSVAFIYLTLMSVRWFYSVILFCISLTTDYTEHFFRLVYIFNINYNCFHKTKENQ